MRKLLISAALATATVAAAVPTAAMAQPGYGWQNRHGVDRGQINNLLRDLNRAAERIDRAMRNGINQREFFSLRAQVNRLQMRVRMENRDRDNRRF